MESVFLTNPILLTLALAALLLTVLSLAIPRGIPSALASVCGVGLVLFCVIYGLLLGASLEEALLLVLVYASVSILTFPSAARRPEEKRTPKPKAPLTEETDDADKASPAEETELLTTDEEVRK